MFSPVNIHKKSLFRSRKNLWVKKGHDGLINYFNCISLSCVHFYKNRQNVMKNVSRDRLISVYKNR